MKRKTVIVGGGISGLYAALLQVKYGKGADTIIIDNKKIGGLFSSHNYSSVGKFDIGTHILSETGIKEIDEILEPFYLNSNWNIMTGNTRDLCGTLQNGKLFTNTAFIDLAFLSSEMKMKIIDEISNLTNNSINYYDDNLERYLKNKYGNIICEIYRPIIESKFKIELDKLSKYALNFLPLSKFNLFNTTDEYYQNINIFPKLKEIIAFPNQREIPVEYTSQRKCYYPKKIGIELIVDEIKEYLINHNVEIYENQNTNIESSDNDKINVVSVDGKRILVENIFWSAGLIPYAKFIKYDFNISKLDEPLNTIIFHFLCNKKLVCDDVFYFYNLDTDSNLYRLTCYQNFTDVENELYTKFSVECIDRKHVSISEVKEKLILKLINSNILLSSEQIVFSNHEILTYGFPLPTVKNYNILNSLRENVASRYKNVTLLGLNSSEKLFFYRDILIDVYNKISKTSIVN
jgi:protoporphyrinogen oxidase